MLSGSEETCGYTIIRRCIPQSRPPGIKISWPSSFLTLHSQVLSRGLVSYYVTPNVFCFHIAETFTTFHHPRRFLWECVDDLNQNLSKVGGKLHIFKGCPLAVIRYLHKKHRITSLSMDLSREPSTYDRDLAIEGTVLLVKTLTK